MSKRISNHLKKGYSDYNLFFVKRYYKEIQRDNKILDVGCGHLRNLNLFYNLGFKNLYGIDKYLPEPNLLDNNLKVEFIQRNILDGLPYKDRQFEIVLCNFVLMFIESTELEKVIFDILRVTKHFCIIETQNNFYKYKKTEIKDYSFKDIVNYIENSAYFEILDKKDYDEKLIVRRK